MIKTCLSHCAHIGCFHLSYFVRSPSAVADRPFVFLLPLCSIAVFTGFKLRLAIPLCASAPQRFIPSTVER
jgi:hypothetical protein